MKATGSTFRLLTAAQLGTRVLALWKLFRHPQTPLPAKIVAAVVVAYALSPIDLIPDFIPVLGLLDELVLVPLGIALVLRLTPPALWQACLLEAQSSVERAPKLWWAAVCVILIWLLLVTLLGWWLWRAFGTSA